MFFLCCLFLLAADVQCPKEVRCLTERTVDTSHTLQLNDQTIDYIATAGNLVLKNADGKGEASLFYVAYTKKGVADPATRPVTFCFNGGPGSSAVWLNLGAFGPKRVDFDDFGIPLQPYHLVDNRDTLLDVTDLVFIDPVSTGYSRTSPDVDAKKYHGVETDIQSVGEFIRRYTTKMGRWTSPKYLAGESYGTTRAAGLANYLNENYYLELQGIIFISAVLDFQLILAHNGNDLPYLTSLPTLSEVAAYHKKLSPELLQDSAKRQKEVRNFIFGEYAIALLKGNALSHEERELVADKLVTFTGLPKELVLECNLRIPNEVFEKALLKESHDIVSRFDGRVVGFDDLSLSRFARYDTYFSTLLASFTSVVNQYLKADLEWQDEVEYEVLSHIHHQWDFGMAKNQYVNMNDVLGNLMTNNSQCKVFVASGLYDLATPFFSTVYTFSHLDIDPRLFENIKMKAYPAGHMMYTQKESREALNRDLHQFYR